MYFKLRVENKYLILANFMCDTARSAHGYVSARTILRFFIFFQENDSDDESESEDEDEEDEEGKNEKGMIFFLI